MSVLRNDFMVSNQIYLSYHLDNLRKQKGYCVEEFVFGICSDRQYRRYISGENLIPSNNISKFCNKLDISLSDFFYSLNQKDRYDYKKLSNIYQLLIKNNMNDAYKLLSDIQSPELFDQQNYKFFKYLMIRINYELGKTNINEMFRCVYKIINLNHLQLANLYSFVDILFLHLMCRHEVNYGQYDTLHTLEKILKSDESIYISSENKTILPPIYANVSSYLGKLGFIKESLSLAITGLRYCQDNNLTDSLPHLYYSKMLGYLNTNKYESAQLSAIECLSACVSTNKKLYVTYYELIKNDLGLEPNKLFTNNNLKQLAK